MGSQHQTQQHVSRSQEICSHAGIPSPPPSAWEQREGAGMKIIPSVVITALLLPAQALLYEWLRFACQGTACSLVSPLQRGFWHPVVVLRKRMEEG